MPEQTDWAYGWDKVQKARKAWEAATVAAQEDSTEQPIRIADLDRMLKAIDTERKARDAFVRALNTYAARKMGSDPNQTAARIVDATSEIGDGT